MAIASRMPILVLGLAAVGISAVVVARRGNSAHAEFPAPVAQAPLSVERLPAAPPPPPAAPPDVAAPPERARRLPDGVASVVLAPGSGTGHPAPNDRVSLQYTSWKRDGTFADSSRPRGAPAVQTVRALLPGLAETIQSMVVGEERRVWIPAALTYRPDEPEEAPPNVDLTFDVTLVDWTAAPATPSDLESPPRSSKRTASGLAYQLLAKGSGEVRPGPASHVMVRHSGWTTDGRLFESSAMAGQPVRFAITELVPGLREGIMLMHEGDQMRFWIPAPLAYGEKPRRGLPKGMLIFDVELLSIELR